MRKFKEKLKKLTAMSLVTAVLVTAIDTSAFADELKAVNYAGVGYDTIAEAISAAEEAGDTTPDIQVQKSMTLTEPIEINEGRVVNISAAEQIPLFVEGSFSIPETSELQGVINIAKDATLTLTNLIIAGNTYGAESGIVNESERHNAEVVNINNGVLNMSNTQIRDFCSLTSAVIMDSSNLIMDDSSALLRLRYQSINGSGGAIYATGECEISGGAIEKGYSYGSGGGIRSTGSVIVEGVSFVQNESNGSGSAIWAENGYVKDCTFDSNFGGITGAAVCTKINGEIYNCSFTNTKTDRNYDGGAVEGYSGNVVIGGIHCEGLNGKPVITMSSATGKILDEASHTTEVFGTVNTNANEIMNCTNTGGTIFVDLEGTLTIEQAAITGNQATYGGGIRNRGALDLHNVKIENNTASESNNINNLVQQGDGIYNAGTLNLYGGVQIKDQIYLEQDKKITVKEILNNHAESEKAIKVAVAESIGDTFRHFVEYDIISKVGQDENINEIQAYSDSVNGVWYLQSVSEERNKSVASQGNLVGLFSNIYEKQVVCNDAAGKAIEGVELELYKESDQTQVYLGSVSKTDMEGKITIQRLQEGSYNVKVKSVPEGYLVPTESNDFTVGADIEERVLSISIGKYNEAPVAAITASSITAKAGEDIVFSAENSTDDGDIVSWKWSLGDNNEKTGESVTHYYTKEGDYTVTLEVTDDGGRTSTSVISVKIEGIAETVSSLLLTVKNSGDEIVENPVVCVFNEKDEVILQGVGGKDGTCTLLLKNGLNYGIVAAATGYHSRGTGIMMDGEEKEVTLYLIGSETVMGEITVSDMSKQEIIDAGIDTGDDENYRVVKHSLTLMFTENIEVDAEPAKVFQPVEFYTNESNEIVGDDKVYEDPATGIRVHQTGVGKAVYFLVIDGTSKWLKDFFNVRLVVYNNSKVEPIHKCKATINIPEGLSLASMTEGTENEAVKTIGTVAPESNVVSEWYIRGDVDGDYQVSANIEGYLAATEESADRFSIEQTIICNEPLRVRAGSSLFLAISAEEYTYTHDNYTVTYTYTNVSDKTLYDLQFSFDREVQYASDGRLFNLDYNPGQRVVCESLAPGQSIAVKYNTIIYFIGSDGEDAEFQLKAHAFDILGGSNASMPYTFNVIHNMPSLLAKNYFLPDIIKYYAGDPVNMLTGTFEYDYTDYTIEGRHNLTFDRYYSSAVKEDRGLGIGFRHGYDYSLEATADYAKVVYPNGSGVSFEKNEVGEYVNDTGRRLEKTATEYIYTDTGRKYTFDINGKLLTIREKDGWETNITRDTEGNIVQISSRAGSIQLTWENSHITQILAGGVTNIYTYNDENRLISVRNPEQHTMTYGYDIDGYLSGITDFEGTLYVQNTYDAYGRVTYQKVQDEGEYYFDYDDVNRVNVCTGEEGYRHTVKYDENYRVLEDNEKYPISYSYNGLGQITKEADPDGERLYAYDTDGNITMIVYPDKTTEEFIYDDNWRLTEYKNRNDRVTKYTYNDEGFLIKETDPRGNVTTYEYDENGNRILEKGAENSLVQYSYNEAGLVLKKADYAGREWKYTYDGSGRILTETDTANGVTGYAYTRAGKLQLVHDNMSAATYEPNKNGYNLTTVDKNGGMTKTRYNKANKIVSEETPLGYMTTYEYDKRGNLVTTIYADAGTMAYTYDDKGNVLSYTDGEGKTWKYTYDSKGRITAVENPYENSKSKEYDSNGSLIKETDENGAATTYEYDSMGNLLKETDALKQEITYTYDENGNKSSMTDKNGNVTEYSYDMEDRLVLERSEKGATAYIYDGAGNVIRREETGKVVYLYEHDGEGRITSLTDPEGNETVYTYDNVGNLTKVTYPDGGIISYTYDKKGNCLSVKDNRGFTEQYTYDKEDRINWKQDKNGNQYSYTYDFRGNETEIVSPLFTTTKTYDLRGLLKTESTPLGTISYEYDDLGRIIKEVSAAGSETIYTYDKTVNPLTITDGNGKTTTYTYDELGRVKTKTDAEGGEESYVYDGNGNLIEKIDAAGNVTIYEYDSMNNLTLEKDSLGNIRTWQYDYQGNFTAYKDAEGIWTRYEYDKNGNCTRIIDGFGNSISYEYDTMGRQTKEISAEGIIREYTYDKDGNLVSEKDGNGNVTTYTYDGNGNVTKKAKGIQEESYTYDSAGNLLKISYKDETDEENTYDINGNVTSHTDRNGNTTYYEYDKDSNLTKTTDSLGNETAYTYDKEGNMTCLVMYRVKGDESTREETIYRYDGNNRLVKMTDSLGVVTNYTYDAVGNLLSTKGSEGNILAEYEYDKTGLLITKKEGSETTVNYCYNKNGELVSMETPDNTVTFTRDKLDRIVTMNVNNKYTVTNSYDKDGNRIGITYPDKTEVTYEYDGEGNIKKVTDGETVTEYTYDANGNKNSDVINGVMSKMYMYDSNGRLTSTGEPIDGMLTLTNLYKYDSDGNLTYHEEVDIVSGETSEHTYVYDVLGRLTQESSTINDVTTGKLYGYDGAGNLIRELTANDTTIYEYDNANRLTKKYLESAKQSNGTIIAGQSYIYDRYGNQISTLNLSGNSTKFRGSYDNEGNLQSATRYTTEDGARTAVMDYTYDGLGNIITRDTVKTYIDHQSDVTTTKIYDYTKEVPTVLAEYSTDGTIIRYTYGEENTKIGAEVRNNLVYNFGTKDYTLVSDRLGSTRYAIDSEGVVAASAEYSVWGEVTEETGIFLSQNAGTLMLATSYTGYRYERDLDWWDAGARMYAPDIKRFTSRDPEAGNVYEPERINRYIYAGNDPINNIDPDGRSFRKIACDTLSAINSMANKVFEAVGDVLYNNPVMRELAEWYNSIPTEIKYLVGATGTIALAFVAGPQLAAAALIGGMFAGGAVGGVAYAMSAKNSGGWDSNEYWKYVFRGFEDGIFDVGISGFTAGLDELAKSGKLFVNFADETGGMVYKGGSVPDFYVGPNGKALPSQYKDWIGTNIQKELLEQAENPQLQNAIKQLYRGNSFIGDGGTADVIRFEQQTGLMLGKNGGSHVQKGIDMAKYIENKILTQDLSPSDRALATQLLEDLYSALGR